jgi:transcriptional regulator GlxA family with amidase domain
MPSIHGIIRITVEEAVMTKRTVAIYLFDEFEPLDAVGPFEAFICATDEDDNPLFDVGMLGETMEPVAATGGMLITPRWSFETMPELDILLVPGGEGTRALTHRGEIVDWVAGQNERVEMMLSVCTGAHMLAKAGLLKNLKATTYWSTYDWLREIEPTVEVLEGARWADNGRIICSSGVSAGIDMSLHTIERLHGKETAVRAARAMEYEYWPVM